MRLGSIDVLNQPKIIKTAGAFKMKSEAILDYVIVNGEKIKTGDFDYEKAKKYPGIYEVVRVIDGVPLFVEKHLERFRSSSMLLGHEINVDDSRLIDNIKALSEINDCKNGNVKIIINNLDKSSQDTYVFFIKSSYPTPSQIEEGVPVILYFGERHTPNAKTTDLSLREKINMKLAETGAYEALLVSKDNTITEGSRSNVFFVKGDKLYTSPTKKVLPGVTRGYILDICRDLNYEVIEESITLSFIKDIYGLFITGTSPQVLPVSMIDKRSIPSASNVIIRKIRETYEKAVEDYVKHGKP